MEEAKSRERRRCSGEILLVACGWAGQYENRRQADSPQTHFHLVLVYLLPKSFQLAKYC